jgi:hypothetical protein
VGFCRLPGPRVIGDSDDWITSDCIDIVIPGGMLRSKPQIEATGLTNLSEYLGHDMKMEAELRTAGEPFKRLAAHLELPYQPKALISY